MNGKAGVLAHIWNNILEKIEVWDGKVILKDESTSTVAEVSLNGGLKIINSIHAKVHDGKLFHSSHIFTDVADNGVVYILLKTADDVLHFMSAIATEGTCHVRLCEGGTFSANGTSLSLYNKKRSSATTTDATVFHTPTVTTVGTCIRTDVVGAGSGKTGAGTESMDEDEWNLKTNENYLIEITNKSGAISDVGVALRFYVQ